MMMNETRLAYDSAWKNPCILEHLFQNDRKVQKVSELLKTLRLKIKIYSENSWFDIIEE